MRKIVCIYIQERDGTTSFLLPLKTHIQNVLNPVFVDYDIDCDDDPLEKIYKEVSDADIVLFLGHGTSDKLYASTMDNVVLYNENNIAEIAGKRLFLLSCNSADFIKKHNLNNALGFGMLPTSLDDVQRWKKLHETHIDDFTRDEIGIYNTSIVATLKNAITPDSINDYSLLGNRINFYASAEIAKCLISHRGNARYRDIADLIYYFHKDMRVY